MSKYKNEPVYTVDEKRLEELQNGTFPAEKPKPISRFKIGDAFRTEHFPNRPGMLIELHLVSLNPNALRLTGELPAAAGIAAAFSDVCPNCQTPFPAGRLIIPPTGKQDYDIVDESFSFEDFEKKIVEWKLEKVL